MINRHGGDDGKLCYYKIYRIYRGVIDVAHNAPVRPPEAVRKT